MTDLDLNVSANTVSSNGVRASELHFPDDIQQDFMPNLVDFDFAAFSNSFGLYPPHLEHNILTTSDQLSMSSPAPQLGFNTIQPTIVQPAVQPPAFYGQPITPPAVHPVPPSAPLVVTPPEAMAPAFYGQPIIPPAVQPVPPSPPLVVTPPAAMAPAIYGQPITPPAVQPVPPSPPLVVTPPAAMAPAIYGQPITPPAIQQVPLSPPLVVTPPAIQPVPLSAPLVVTPAATNINKGNMSTTVTETTCHLSSDTLSDSQASIVDPSPPQPNALPLEIETQRSSRPVVPSKQVEQMNQIGSKNSTTVASVSSFEKENIPFGVPPAWAITAKNVSISPRFVSNVIDQNITP